MGNRVMVFIDGSNLYRCVLKAFGRRDLDLSKLVTKLVGNRTLQNAYYYNAPLDQATDPEGARAQQKFLNALSWIPRLEVRMGKLLERAVEYKCPECGKAHVVKTHVQKGVDTRLSNDMITLAVSNRYDIAILVSGDSDLVEAVRFVKDHQQKEVENAFVIEGWSPELRGMAQTKTVLDAAFLTDCWLGKAPKSKN